MTNVSQAKLRSYQGLKQMLAKITDAKNKIQHEQKTEPTSIRRRSSKQQPGHADVFALVLGLPTDYP